MLPVAVEGWRLRTWPWPKVTLRGPLLRVEGCTMYIEVGSLSVDVDDGSCLGRAQVSDVE